MALTANGHDLIEYLKTIKHSNIKKIIFNKSNKGLVGPTKAFWRSSTSEYVGKIDNDILVPANFIKILVDAHEKINNLGVVGFCHFRLEDINSFRLKDKIISLSNINIRQQPWIGGNYIMKKTVTKKYPGYNQSWKKFKKRKLYGFNKYQNKLTNFGLINGYIANENKELFFWDHLDDPRNKYYMKNKDYDIRGLTNKEIIKWYKNDASALLVKY